MMSSLHYRKNSASSRQIKHTRIENETEFETHYSFGRLLGKGSFGTVNAATRKSDDTEWAIKSINKEKAGSAAVKLLEREVSIMKKVNHPNIIHLEEVLETTNKMFLVMEICTHGGLEELLLEKSSFSEQETLCIVRQLVDSVAYIHDNDIIHRDLKLDNILLAQPTEDLPYNIKLTDFGLSYTRGGSGNDQMMNQMVGTPIYMAPEVITNYGYSQQCDIWSIGVIFYKLICGDPPFMANTEEELFEIIKKGKLKFTNKKWSNISQAAKQLLEGMMKVDPAHRLTSKEIQFHPWIKGEQNLNGSLTTNVLEMMKEYNLEQKQLAKNLINEELNEVNNNTEQITENNDVLENDIPTKEPVISEECTKRTHSPSTASLSNSKTDTKSSRSNERKTNPKSVTVPSYMQATKSSSAPRNPHTRGTRKKKDPI